MHAASILVLACVFWTRRSACRIVLLLLSAPRRLAYSASERIVTGSVNLGDWDIRPVRSIKQSAWLRVG
jgi:hypothetical protein